MSKGTARTSLYVICNDDEQAKKLIRKFRREDPGDGMLEIWNDKSDPSIIGVELTADRIFHTPKDHIRGLAQWLLSNFNLQLEGYWTLELKDGNYRGEIHNGEVYEVGTDWLQHFTVEEIELTRRWCREQFCQLFHPFESSREQLKITAESPAQLNGGYVYTELDVMCRNEKMTVTLLDKFKQEKNGQNIFHPIRRHPGSFDIIFQLIDRKMTKSIDTQILELDQWLKTNFKLRLPGFWYLDGNDEIYRREINNGKIHETTPYWLLDYSSKQIDQIKCQADTYPFLRERQSPPLPDSVPSISNISPDKTFEKANIKLSVYCRNKEELRDLCRQFEHDKPGYGKFTPKPESENFPYQIYFEADNNPASHSLDQSIQHLQEWIQNNFDLHLRGSWRQFFPRHCHGEINYGRILKRYSGWLINYTNDEQKKIFSIAKDYFTPQNEDDDSEDEE